MGCWKVMDLRLRSWLPWIVMFAAGVIAYTYYQFLNPQNCAGFYVCRLAVEKASFPPVESTTEPMTPSLDQFKPLYNDTRRIAVCIVGGARMFEITGPSLRKHLLDVFNNTDVFLHSPLDADSHKLTLLAGRNLRVAKIFVPQTLPETKIIQEVITSWGSPRGMQGLLQYFNLVEGCYGMVKKYEVQRNFTYDWIIRARADGCWSAPVPDISQLDPNYYYVAAGSMFHGLNDRFGMGSSHTSRAANTRLTLLPVMHMRGLRGLNSESAYKAQLTVSGVLFKPIQVPFCIVTLRTPRCPPLPRGLLLLSMASEGPMSGAYCRPCDAEVNATASAAIVTARERDWDWPGIEGERVTVCDGIKPWAPTWRRIADEVYKRNLGLDEEIRDFQSRSREECIEEMEAFQRLWDIWDSLSPEIICNSAFPLKGW